MKAVQAPVDRTSTPETVIDLQDALLLLLEQRQIRLAVTPEAPDAEALHAITEQIRIERTSGTFGEATLALVQHFQARSGLEGRSPGRVDTETAARLNAALAAIGALDDPCMWCVRGRITHPGGAPATRLQVRAFDRDVSGEDLLGEATTDDDGHYSISYAESRFRRSASERGGPEIFIRVVDVSGQHRAVSKVHDNAPQTLELDLTLPEAALDRFVVSGRVTASDAKPASAFLVKAFDRNVGTDDTLLGEATTDAQGNYTITYSRTQLDGKLAADLLLALYDTEQLKLMSDVIFNARPVETLDFSVPRQTGAPQTEFDRLQAQIRPLLRDKLKLDALQSGDIDFLCGKIDIGRQAVERLTRAHRLATTDDTLAVLYYGLLSQRIATEPAALLARGRVLVGEALAMAAAEGAIPPVAPQVIDRFVDDTLPRLSVQARLTPAWPRGRASLGDVLCLIESAKLNALPEDTRRQIAGLVGDPPVVSETLPAQLAALGLARHQTLAVERSLRLADLAGGNLPLMRSLSAHLRPDDDDGSLRPLASLTRAHWLDFAYAHRVPQDIDLSPDEFGLQLERAVEALHPTAVITERMRTGDLVFDAPDFAQIRRVLEANPGFDLVEADLRCLPDTLDLAGIEDPTALARSLRKLQRVKRLGADWRETGALINADIVSAFDIVNLGPERLQDAMAWRMDASRSQALYDKAKEIHDTGLTVLVNAHPSFSPTSVAAMPISGATHAAQDANLRSLFGAPDGCECPHDLSVLSPAAYFVDLLKFLDPNPATKAWPDGPIGLMGGRRPDLLQLELSGANTHVELPHVDLVLEVLENAVALPLTFHAPAGMNVADALRSQPLPWQIASELRTTALQVGDDFTVRAAGTRDRAEVWTVKNGALQWTLLHNPERQFVMRLAGSPRQVTASEVGIDKTVLAAELDAEHLSAATLREIDALRCARRDGLHLLRTIDHKVLRVGNDRFVLACKLAVTVSVQRQDTPSLVLTAPDGRILLTQSCSLTALNAIVDGLEHGRIAGPLKAYLPQIEIGRIEAIQADSSWSITIDFPDIDIVDLREQVTIAALSYQSTEEQRGTAVWPAHQNPRAYASLREATFPWTLPFDSTLETVRACLDRTGTSRRELLERAMPGKLSDARFTHEVLGLSLADAHLIASTLPTTTDNKPLWQCWGVAPDATNKVSLWSTSLGQQVVFDTPYDALCNVGILTQQARISVDEMYRLLATSFVGADWLSVAPAGGCKPSELTLSDLQIDHLERLPRFVRLWRKLGGSIEALDFSMLMLSPDTDHCLLTADTLHGLAHLRRLSEALGLQSSHIASWYKPQALAQLIDLHTEARSERTLYAQLFQNTHVQNPPAAAMKWDERSGQPVGKAGSATLSSCIAEVAAGLGLKQADLKRFIDAAGLPDLLSLENLHALYRSFGLMGALRIGVDDYLALLRVSGIVDPFASPARTIEFIESVSLIQGSAFSAEETSYLLRNEAPRPGSTFGISDDQIASTLQSLRAALEKRLTELSPRIDELVGTLAPDTPSSRPDAAASTEVDWSHAAWALTSSEELRAHLRDQVTEHLSTALALAGPVVRRLLSSEVGRTAHLQHPVRVGFDAIEVFTSFDFITANSPAAPGATPRSVPGGTPTAPHRPDVMTGGSRRDVVVPSDEIKVRTDWESASDVIERLHKCALILSRLKIEPTELDWIAGPNGMTSQVLGQLPVHAGGAAVPLPAWRRLVTLYGLRDRAAGAPALLDRYVQSLQLVGDADAMIRARATLSSGLGLTADEVQAAADGLNIKTPDAYRDPIQVAAWWNLMVTAARLGASMAQVQNLCSADWATPEAAALASATARTLLRSKFGDQSWRDVAKPTAARLRARQRNALVQYLVASNGLRDADDLYDRLLIDPQMTPSVTTTRLLQATASVQQFIQRCLLGLEPQAVLSATQRQRWEWMKNYRVWEANRKVFLYPENWLHPELRDDATEAFSQFEGGMAQSEPSYDLVVENLQAYTEELGEIAKLKMLGMFEDVDATGLRTLYCVGRLPNQPYAHYWRMCTMFGQSSMRWSGWRKIDLDIADDHVMPFVLDGDFHIAWPSITKTAAPEGATDKRGRWKIKLNWARVTPRGSAKKKISRDALPLDGWRTAIYSHSSIDDAARELTFRLIPGSNGESMAFVVHDVVISHYTPALESLAAVEPNCEPTVSGYEPQTVDSATNEVTDRGYSALKTLMLNEKYDNDHYGPENVLSPSVFTFRLYCRYEDERGRYYYGPAAGRNLTCSVYCVLNDPDSSAPETLFNAGSVAMAEQPGAGGTYTYTLDWVQFIGLGGPTRFLRRIEFGLETSSGRKTVATYVPKDSNELPLSYDAGFVFGSALTPHWSTSPAGQFVLTLDGDMTVQAPDSTCTPMGAGPWPSIIYANGFRTYGGTEFEVQAQQSASWRQMKPPAGLSDSDLWHRHTTDARIYVQRYAKKLGANGPEAVFSHLEVFDKIADTASLRSRSKRVLSGPQGYYSIGSQRSLQSSAATVDDREPALGWSWLKGVSMPGFDVRFPAAIYNIELFCHVPLLATEILLRQQRFEDARRVLHLVFDPTTDESSDDVERCWKFLPFRQAGADVLWLLKILAAEQSGDLPDDAKAFLASILADFSTLIDEWRNKPFLPHAIARSRLRQKSYQWRALFNYLDILIGWGDQLFRRDTRESINEATQLYVLAAKLLGARPATIRPTAPPPPTSYLDLRHQWDDFSNAWVTVTDSNVVRRLAFQSKPEKALDPERPDSSDYARPSDSTGVTWSLQMLFFCIPHNDKLLEYWDQVEDRLMKLRHSLNIDGVERSLPLWEPPIDPDLLVRATAAGLSIADVLNEMAAPLLPYRFQVLVQKAAEICGEVKALGTALLNTLEKQDAENLALLRSGQETAMLGLIKQVRQYQIDEANARIEALKQSQAVSMERFNQYRKLMGNQPTTLGPEGVPVLGSTSKLQVAANAPGEASGLGLIQHEVAQLNSLGTANNLMTAAGTSTTIASILHSIPDVISGSSLVMQTKIGGSHLGNAANAAASLLSMLAARAHHDANEKALLAQYQRRHDEWVHQSRLAVEELRLLNREIVAADIRRAIAERELQNHDKQIENARQIDEFLHDKYTNHALYAWMASELSGVYFQSYKLAFDLAKRAERAYRAELAIEQPDFIHFGYWDSLKKGLSAGENLSLAIRRMEVGYLQNNKRPYELTTHVSLLQLDPQALVMLRQNRRCEFDIPEAYFDMACPGHFMRRIKSVSVSIPCVTGPYTSVHCTLTLLSSAVRKSATGQAYGRPSPEDKRFDYRCGAIQSIVTSSGQADAGVFEANLHDERYLPFEGAGAVSTWQLELPAAMPSFDHATISDVILHLRYTAVEGGTLLRDAAIKQLTADGAPSPTRLVTVRSEFPMEWARFIAARTDENTAAELTIEFKPEHYPYWARDSVADKPALFRVYAKPVFAVVDGTEIPVYSQAAIADVQPVAVMTGGQMDDLLSCDLKEFPFTTAIGRKSLYFGTNALSELWLLVGFE